jgi:hypothetical protein
MQEQRRRKAAHVENGLIECCAMPRGDSKKHKKMRKSVHGTEIKRVYTANDIE